MIKKEQLYLFGTILIVFLFYFHTLNYPWRDFDESLIFKELIYPIPRDFQEFLVYAKEFGFMVYFEASNVFYSSIRNIRCDPVNAAISMLVEMYLQTNPVLYHCLSLGLHLLNTALLFKCLQLRKLSLIFVSLLTLLWALHPVNVECILFACNWAGLLAYSFAFSIFYLCIRRKND